MFFHTQLQERGFICFTLLSSMQAFLSPTHQLVTHPELRDSGASPHFPLFSDAPTLGEGCPKRTFQHEQELWWCCICVTQYLVVAFEAADHAGDLVHQVKVVNQVLQILVQLARTHVQLICTHKKTISPEWTTMLADQNTKFCAKYN